MDLFAAILQDANLSGASLCEANLSGAVLIDANLTDASLTGATWCDGGICSAGSTGTCETGARFMDNCDGTISDADTGLMWEKKTGTPDILGTVVCDSADECPDPHDVNNRYTWSSTGENFDGTASTVFLAQLNDVAGGGTNCFAGHCDWRLPEVNPPFGPGAGTGTAELETIVDCSFSPCINPIFGPTAASFYWSATTDATNPNRSWAVGFGLGLVFPLNKDAADIHVRAVRTGP